MKAQAIIYRIKPRKLKTWRAWCHALDTRLRANALHTLKEEKSTIEFFINFKIGQNWYALGSQIGMLKPSNVKREINRKHRKIRLECLEPISRAEYGYFLQLRG
ncbi:MAG: hypothetical protein HY421_02250 [Candidatus Kerfeldbacteria bacterium]|nr:hypothetical protein [Candidatus Kerfeldbacteria bacterium]